MCHERHPWSFFQDMQHRIAAAIPPAVRQRMDSVLLVPDSKVISPFETMKLDARSENQLYRELLADLKRVDGKI